MIGWYDKGLTGNYNQYKMSLSILCRYRTAYLASLYMVLAPFDTLGGTRGRAIEHQASTSCYKGVHPYSWDHKT